ncbi:MAG: helix-hairpin-helix domain-containing protein [Nitrospirota bacterium]
MSVTSNHISVGRLVHHRRAYDETIQFRCPWALAATDLQRCPTHPPWSSAGDRGNKADLLDFNTATAELLKALSGIGEACLKKIIKSRPYQRKNDPVQQKEKGIRSYNPTMKTGSALMTRPFRVAFLDAVYQVTSRGNAPTAPCSSV